MNTILGALAGGRNIIVLLLFAVIGYTLCITPPLDTFACNDFIGRGAAAFGWNFLAAVLFTWFIRLLIARTKYRPSEYKFAYAYLVAGLAAVAGVLF